jgi:hypothetical protein
MSDKSTPERPSFSDMELSDVDNTNDNMEDNNEVELNDNNKGKLHDPTGQYASGKSEISLYLAAHDHYSHWLLQAPHD